MILSEGYIITLNGKEEAHRGWEDGAYNSCLGMDAEVIFFLSGKVIRNKSLRAAEQLLIQVVVLPTFAFVSEYFAYRLPFLPTF